MSDSDLQLSSPSSPDDTILIADASEEGSRLASGLREKGYAVIEAPLALVESRALVETPKIVILATDEPGVEAILERLSALENAKPSIFGIGAHELNIQCDAFFERPVSLETLLSHIEPLVQPSRYRVRTTTPPPSFAPRLQTGRPPPLSADDLDLEFTQSITGSDLEEELGPLSLDGLDHIHGKSITLSDDLVSILRNADQVAQASLQNEPRNPPIAVFQEDDTNDIALSPEILAVLGEPVEPATDDVSNVTNSPTSAPKQAIPSLFAPATLDPNQISESAVPHTLAIDSPSEPPVEEEEQLQPASPDQEQPDSSELQIRIRNHDEIENILGSAIANRTSGCLSFHRTMGLIHVVLRDGDFVVAMSESPEETIVDYLVERGDIPQILKSSLHGQIPGFGRHAGAALIAHGHLVQDDLWPTLRAHAEWIIARLLKQPYNTCLLSREPSPKLATEPNVFGGAAGAEVFLDVLRRVVDAPLAMQRLGGEECVIQYGSNLALLSECALSDDEQEILKHSRGRSLGDLVQLYESDFAVVVYALRCLSILEVSREQQEQHTHVAVAESQQAIRERVMARYDLIEEGDYFQVLGIPRDATNYEVKRAYLSLRRAFEPARIVSGQTIDLVEKINAIQEVIEEAYLLLREPMRRNRYRTAIEKPPISEMIELHQ